MPEFQVGDRVRYPMNTPLDGTINRITHEALIVEFDRGSNLEGERAFDLDGQINNYAGAYTECGVRWANTPGSHLVLLSSAREPSIAFGVWVAGGYHEVPPGYTGEAVVGYAIQDTNLNWVAPTEDDPNLQHYFTAAQTQWQDQGLRRAYQQVQDKMQLLIGCRFLSAHLTSDSAEFRVDVGGARVTLTNPDCISYGLRTLAEIRSHLREYMPRLVDIQDEVFIFDDGFRFGMTSRFAERTPFVVNIDSAAQPAFMRNLDTQRTARDSELVAA